MRKIEIADGEYYHIYNRGVNKQKIFYDKADRVRFLFYIIYYQSPLPLYNISRKVTQFLKTGFFNLDLEITTKILKNRYVELVTFTLMPNHFHLSVGQKESGGVADYLMRIQDGYTKYFNTKYKKSGHLFEGPYKAVHISNNSQLLHLSSYIHKNSKELKEWRNQWESYPWSSYQDFIVINRWGDFLSMDIILKQFKDSKEYIQFVETGSAKEVLDRELLIDLLGD